MIEEAINVLLSNNNAGNITPEKLRYVLSLINQELLANHLKGDYDIVTNLPLLVNGVGKIGDEYRCTTAGVRDFGSGNITVSVNDVLMYNGVVWFLKVNNNQATKAHNHLSTDISDLNETVEDIIGTKIKAGANVSVAYNDVTGETTIYSAGGVDATALHKTGDESFTGVKTLNSTNVLPAGIDINNNGGVRGFVNRWFNVIAGIFNVWSNQNTGFFNVWYNQNAGIFNKWYNQSTGVFNYWLNQSNGDFNYWLNQSNGDFNNWKNNSNGNFNVWSNQSTGIFNSWENQSTGVFSRITSATASTGDLFQFFKDAVKTASINHLGHFTSNKFINPTGQGFLKANGDIDTSTYKLDTPFFRHYGALLFDGITQTGHQDIPLGAGVDGKLEVTIFGLWQLFNISGSCSAVIDVFVNSGGSIGRNDLKHKDVNLNMASQYEIQGVVVVGGLPYLRIKKLTALQNFISVTIKYQGTNYAGLYAPSNPLPFVGGTQNPTEVQNVKLVLTNTTLTAKDWVNVNQVLLVTINGSSPVSLTLAPGVETKGFVTQIINVGTAAATIVGASTGTFTLNTNQGATITSNGNNIKLH
ncbi:hypothetical protein [Flavobacterium psychrophilum]|uniref:hypothetical protein n=1 Tax=Flavobacterium psychrophilum TaxID=96345 RepID=UPI000B7C2F70|nr:hypothetical protein [Flavobacterium psychrophilum]SNA77278.1 hypothetical protein FI070_30127 [Flavobacterium psychrophilum]